MSDNWASVGGSRKGIASFTNNYPIFMVSPLKSGGFITLDTVSGIASDGSFTATFDRSGHPIPIQLGPKG